MKGFSIKAIAGVIVLEIYGEIGYWSNLEEFLRWQIMEFGEQAPLVVRMSSPGGDPRVGLSLYQIIRDHKGSTEAYIEYQCDSSATLPICACDHVYANRSPFEFMIHDPKMAMDWSTVEEGQALVDLTNMVRDEMVKAYVAKTGQSEDQIRKWMKDTKFFNAEEAEQAGFVDEIKEVEQTLAAKVDMKLAASAHEDVRPDEFKIIGRDKSPEPNQSKQIKSKMEEFFKKVKAAFGLGDTSDEADVVITAKELKAKADKADQLEQDLADERKEKQKLQDQLDELKGEEPTEEELEEKAEKEVDDQLEAAVKDFKITASAKENYAKTYKGKPDDLKAALELIPEGAAKPSGAPRPSTSASAARGVNENVSKHFKS